MERGEGGELCLRHALTGPARCAGEVLHEPRCDGIPHVKVLGHGPELHLLDVDAKGAGVSIPARDESPAAVMIVRHVEERVEVLVEMMGDGRAAPGSRRPAPGPAGGRQGAQRPPCTAARATGVRKGGTVAQRRCSRRRAAQPGVARGATGAGPPGPAPVPSTGAARSAARPTAGGRREASATSAGFATTVEPD